MEGNQVVQGVAWKRNMTSGVLCTRKSASLGCWRARESPCGEQTTHDSGWEERRKSDLRGVNKPECISNSEHHRRERTEIIQVSDG
jgi:hypothetical protein